MKYLKKYDNQNNKLQVGGYVICLERTEYDILNNFLENNMGRIKSYFKTLDTYEVEFENVENITQYLKNSFLNGSNRRYCSNDDLRKATPEEIDDFLLRKNIKIYNL